jgi:F1F0 ATPase subunit 2
VSDLAGVLGAALAGALLGLAYFAGLWWTVRRAGRARHPAALVAASFVVRAALAVTALLYIMAGDVVRLLVALGAFLVVRTAALWRVRRGLHGAGRVRVDGLHS